MTTVADGTLGGIIRQAKADLAFFPGRVAMAWRVAVLCALMAMIAMIYGIPESAISCYLIIFVMKPDGVESMVMAVAITILVSLVVGLVFLLIHFTLEAAPLRMAALIVSSFLFLYLGSASKLGPVGSIIALVIAYVMTLLSNIPMGEVATRGLLYAWLMAVSPMLLIIGFNLFFGRAPQTLLRASLAERLSTVAETLRHPNAANMARVGEQLQEGQHEHQQRALFVRIFHLRPSAEAAWLESAVKSSYRLLLVTSALPPTSPEAVRLELAAYCSDAAQAIASGDLAAPPHFAIEDTSDEINEIRNALIALANADNGQDLDAPKSSFFAADALTNPVHQQFALKTTAAALICYLIYTALDWQDIHTAMITCYVAALGTTGETVHKLVLRIIGCLIGALMGVLSIIFIIPHMSDIGQLMALVFGCILVAAWVSCGSERIAYAGVQVGLAFLLTVLQGFGPSTDMGVALDRVLGILLGNLVVYLIFSRLWPVAITDAVHVHISRALKGLTNLAALSPDARPAALREATTVEAEITKAQEELALIPFEPVQFRPSRKECARLQAILAEMGKLCPVLFLPTEKSASDVEQLRQLSAGSDAMTLSDEQGQNSGSLRQELSPINLTIQQRIKRLEELLGI
ncbi:aluminum activated malate transporter family protein [Yersinia pseudotuberculosis]|uniref:FUSC family protein n=1 Tax=Yersinia pseudotuberculosis TaxID=633 RepID=UPI0001739873|nr:FUSC family protein [Yersinia pseudotuberculosis]CQD58352.1 membrane protein [Yersinia intermedia]AIN16023.1 aluminum activated malate transporter family protein [Yersinia pseudotuberculosis]AJJ04733.1 aluminum activated malate transporter family protein [Yersinia pseudotuberculosis]AJJ05417.1 aluminum activated malate transporter family protein [Yersinia pseudotuberculosis]AJJ69240.1 aluminum activated malate transporter family protein [Yersinia pseudotuberculosis PB1/+]